MPEPSNDKIRTETVETMHGTIETDVVDCENCGSGVILDDALRYGIEPTVGRANLYADKSADELVDVDGFGYLCDYCSESVFNYTGNKDEEIPVRVRTVGRDVLTELVSRASLYIGVIIGVIAGVVFAGGI